MLFVLAGVLGVAAVMLPALASSETTPTITAENVGGGLYGAEHHWTPATATIAANGVVTLSNPTEVDHGVEWVSDPGRREAGLQRRPGRHDPGRLGHEMERHLHVRPARRLHVLLHRPRPGNDGHGSRSARTGR